ncbi:MAG: hypothetical protein ABEJ23_05400 [Haloarculaceae archaeon]
MTRFDATTPADRRALYAEAVAAHRRRGSDGAAFVAGGRRLELTDDGVRFDLRGDERAALDDLLADYPVFKVAQPATRKAPDGVVYVSAVTDAKHLGDFLEDAFRRVLDRPEDYRGWVVAV